jgi:hypothetical protein
VGKMLQMRKEETEKSADGSFLCGFCSGCRKRVSEPRRKKKEEMGTSKTTTT